MVEENRYDYDVIHFGQYYCDLIFTGLPHMPELGAEIHGTGLQLGPGGAFNTSYALHRLGLKTGWICDLGNDFFSQFVNNTVQKLGMDTALFRYHSHDLCAVTAAFSFQDDRGFISYLDRFEPAEIISAVESHRSKIVLIGGLSFGAEFDDLLRAARNSGARLVMDCQHREVDLQTPGVAEAIQAVDVFLPNICEAKRLTGQTDPEKAVEALAQVAKLLVVKQGCQGALAVSGGQVLRAPAICVEEVVDTTGAGDCFNAGFLYGWLKGAPLDACLKYGNICGGVSVTGFGVSQVPDREQVDEMFLHFDALVGGNPCLIPRQPPIGLVFTCNKGQGEKK
jgi:sugar/nucleoside kinase (ribokinase family)